MESIVVTFVDARTVFIDGNPSGQTNQTLTVEAGTHKIDLGTPHNYHPSFRRPKVSGTSDIDPLEVIFKKGTP